MTLPLESSTVLESVAKLLGAVALGRMNSHPQSNWLLHHDHQSAADELSDDELVGALLDVLVARGGYAMSEGGPVAGVTILHLTRSGQGPTRLAAVLALAEALP
jgi:hypothetical protein